MRVEGEVDASASTSAAASTSATTVGGSKVAPPRWFTSERSAAAVLEIVKSFRSLYFEPSLDALSLRSNVISSIKVLSFPGPFRTPRVSRIPSLHNTSWSQTPQCFPNRESAGHKNDGTREGFLESEPPCSCLRVQTAARTNSAVASEDCLIPCTAMFADLQGDFI